MTGDPLDNFSYLNVGPENSRRLRALPVWFSLMAYGRTGHQRMVEQSISLARHFGEQISHAGFLQPEAPGTDKKLDLQGGTRHRIGRGDDGQIGAGDEQTPDVGKGDISPLRQYQTRQQKSCEGCHEPVPDDVDARLHSGQTCARFLSIGNDLRGRNGLEYAKQVYLPVKRLLSS